MWSKEYKDKSARDWTNYNRNVKANLLIAYCTVSILDSIELHTLDDNTIDDLKHHLTRSIELSNKLYELYLTNNEQ